MPLYQPYLQDQPLLIQPPLLALAGGHESCIRPVSPVSQCLRAHRRAPPAPPPDENYGQTFYLLDQRA